MVLLVFEGFGAADVPEHELGEGGGDDVPVFAGNGHGHLAAVIDGEGGAVEAIVREEKFRGRTQSEKYHNLYTLFKLQ